MYNVQPMFCRFSSANELEHMSDRSMLVLYPASTVVISVGKFVLYLRTDFKSP